MSIKTAVGYEQKPPQCVNDCPFDDARANLAGVQFAPDCKGPSVIDSVDPPVIGTLEVDGTIASYDPTSRKTAPLGSRACRGAWQWVMDRQAAILPNN